MTDITNLAETIGLSTQQRPNNSSPFTRAAERELQTTIAERNAEKRALAEQEKIANEIKRMVKPIPTLSPEVNKKIANIVSTAIATPNLSREEAQTAQNKVQQLKLGYDLYRKQEDQIKQGRVAVPKKVSDAFLSGNKAEIEKVAALYPNDVEYNEEAEQFYLKTQLPKVDTAKYLGSLFKEGDYVPRGVPKNGYQPMVVNRPRLDLAVSEIINNQDGTIRKNIIIDNEDKIAEIMKTQNVDQKTAEDAFILDTVYKYAQKQKQLPKARPTQTVEQKAAYKRDGNGVWYSEKGDFTATPVDPKNPNSGEYILETVGKTPIGVQNIEFLKDETLTEFGEPVKKADIIVRKIKYKGGDKITIDGDVKDGVGKEVPLLKPIEISLQQAIAKYGAPLINDAIVNDYNNANKGKSKPAEKQKSMAELMREAAAKKGK